MRRFTTRPAAAAPYRGPAGLLETFFVAVLDDDYRVVRVVSPVYITQAEGLSAWMRRRDRRARLVRELRFIEVLV